MRVAVIGCGNVGFAYLVWMKKRGFNVLGYDTDLKVREKIAKTIGENCVAYDFKDLSFCDSIHICVPTEPAKDGSADLSIYNAVIEQLASVLDNRRQISVIQRSTCPPGSADRYAEYLGKNISYGVNPSFLRKASIIQDTEYPERVAIGGKGLSVVHMSEIYHDIMAPRYITENRTSVELLKYVENTIDAMLISYWNEILEYSVSLGLDMGEILRLIEKIGDRKKFQTVSRVPGMAFGLWCLPKDLRALINEMKKKNITCSFMEGIWDTNLKFEQQVGVGVTPAQSLWEMSNGQVHVLKDGRDQISSYMERKREFL